MSWCWVVCSYRGGSQSPQEGEDDVFVCFRIKTLLEYLFSDAHLAEDGFLLKHIQKNKQGYVSLKLLTCLKKVKKTTFHLVSVKVCVLSRLFTFQPFEFKQSWGWHCLLQIKALTTNWCMTLAAAVYSDLLEVNDECTKVRRIEPLPKWLLCSPTTKLLLAWNLSGMQTGENGAAQGLESLSISEKTRLKFSAYGCVTSVCVLHPGQELPKELQCYAKRHKEIGQHLCAVVKFNSLSGVREVYNALKAEEEKSKGTGMCVVPLGFQSMRHMSEDDSSEERKEDRPGDTPSQENPSETSEDSVQEELSPAVSVSDEIPNPCLNPNNCTERTPEQPLSGLNHWYSRMSWCSGDFIKGTSESPWVLRRKCTARANCKAAGHLNVPYMRVLRQPLGPEGTRGFHRRGKILQQEKETTCS